MWMSDKPKIQNELAENLSQLMHAFPSSTLKTRFIHSFFKTIHREWHGIDGLRLDKYYSLIRKMMFQSFKVRSKVAIVTTFASHLSSEILSKLPNGLRLHLCDVYVQELHKSAGATIESENLVMLLEPFFTLISSETDKIVTKRVNDMVFQVLLTDYEFQDTLKDKEVVASTDSEDNDDESAEADEHKVFGVAHLAQVQHRIFDLAAAEDTHDRNRNILYSIYSALYAATKVDSAKKDRKRSADDGDEKSATISKKQRRKAKASSAKEEPAEKMQTVDVESATKEVVTTKKEKSAPKKEVASPKKEAVPPKEELSPKKVAKKDIKAAVAGRDDDVKVETNVARKKGDKAASKMSAKPPASQKEQPTPYPRCTSCGGFGKGLVPVNKSMCTHCDREIKQEAKAKTAKDKKRKAAAVAEASAEAEAAAEASKKVRFGTNKALPYELSMKRMKKSVEKELVKPATGKGVLKVKEIIATATSNVKKNTTLNVKRARAADFF
ncbi:hypothetical protein DYB32_000922 [Aphanomyces invadans]|uniref:Uncharacterized protein n=1 Tax=Aphanomyces invadans TaxID=157072 RepID=A0A418B8J2_9STRA|nr:hypothetical protein DYB32_000922 [Aphanomyces invadans]